MKMRRFQWGSKRERTVSVELRERKSAQAPKHALLGVRGED